ncbi:MULTISPECIES: hypothetical protein [Shewanella]|uniref:hypothetical protein n=1 Tax=Shewanella TaxID=22 RepID=UPI0012F86D7E|nr:MULTISPECIES: hypothetical protein [Shewanella]
MDELFDIADGPEQRLARYQACLQEFERLNHEDNYVKQIRQEIQYLQRAIKSD